MVQKRAARSEGTGTTESIPFTPFSPGADIRQAWVRRCIRAGMSTSSPRSQAASFSPSLFSL